MIQKQELMTSSPRLALPGEKMLCPAMCNVMPPGDSARWQHWLLTRSYAGTARISVQKHREHALQMSSHISIGNMHSAWQWMDHSPHCSLSKPIPREIWECLFVEMQITEKLAL